MRAEINFVKQGRILENAAAMQVLSEGTRKLLRVETQSNFPQVKLDEILVFDISGGLYDKMRVEFKGPLDSVNSFEVDISEMREPDVVSLRIKLVHMVDGFAKIVQELENLVPESDPFSNTGSSLLPAVYSSDLKVPWAIDLSSSGPRLVICNKNGIGLRLVSDPIFQALIFPRIVHDIARWLAAVPEEDHSEKQRSWVEYLFSLGAELPEWAEIDESDDASEQIESFANLAAVSFSNKFLSVAKLSNLFGFDEE